MKREGTRHPNMILAVLYRWNLAAEKRQRKSFGVSVNGELTINAKLLRHFPEYKMDIRISPDWSEIVLFLKGKEMIHVGKNGRTKNYDLQKRWKEQKKLPAYYIGEWDEEEELWYGKYLPYNPNRGEKQLKKWRDVFVKVVYEVR